MPNFLKIFLILILIFIPLKYEMIFKVSKKLNKIWRNFLKFFYRLIFSNKLFKTIIYSLKNWGIARAPQSTTDQRGWHRVPRPSTDRLYSCINMTYRRFTCYRPGAIAKRTVHHEGRRQVIGNKLHLRPYPPIISSILKKLRALLGI